MAAVSLFRGSNMAVVTSRFRRLCRCPSFYSLMSFVCRLASCSSPPVTEILCVFRLIYLITSVLWLAKLRGWHLTTERQRLLRNLFSQQPYKRVAWMFLWLKIFSGNLTSLQSESAWATSPSPLLCVSVKNVKKLSGNERGRCVFFSPDGNLPIIFLKP